MSSLNIATLFSRIGAPEQGAMRVYDNVHTVFACEYDKFARQSYQANYDIDLEHFHKDVNDLDATPYKGKVDVVVGGSPCQDFSIAGKGAGFDGIRGSLTGQFVRVVSEVMPPVFIFENVPGITTAKFRHGLKLFQEEHLTDGYMVGLYNGLELALATMEDRECQYKDNPFREKNMGFDKDENRDYVEEDTPATEDFIREYKKSSVKHIILSEKEYFEEKIVFLKISLKKKIQFKELILEHFAINAIVNKTPPPELVERHNTVQTEIDVLEAKIELLEKKWMSYE